MRPYWLALRSVVHAASTLLLRTRFHGIPRVPVTGGVMLVCNHQSFFDPPLVAMGLPRESCFMARDTLFENRWFTRLIRSLNAFPVRRGAADVSAIKEALRRLKSGMSLVVFPEGTRTQDGRIGRMLPGPGSIARKAAVPIVPTLIDGAFQCWPRDAKWPRIGDVIIEYGRPVHPDEYAGLSGEQLMDLIGSRLVAMQRRWHRRVPSRRLPWYDEKQAAGCGALL